MVEQHAGSLVRHETAQSAGESAGSGDSCHSRFGEHVAHHVIYIGAPTLVGGGNDADDNDREPHGNLS